MLARQPAVVVIDELAHTNAPGSRHPKRWQDIEDLLAAGITVLSTLNIQHLESLNDVIERITGVRQQETVPDEVVRRAEQVELVDITPEALRRRLAHGNVYPPERVDAAMANYFQPHNLTALREMALLWVADQVEVALQRYRTDQRVTDIWETRERVVVAFTGGPESETVLRRAARIAKRSGSAELFAVHVLRGDGLASDKLGRPVGALAGLRRLAEDVGASFHYARWSATTCPPRCSTSPAASTPPSWCWAPPGGPGWPARWSRASGPGWCRTPGTSTCTWSATARPAGGCGCPGCPAPCRCAAARWAGRWRLALPLLATVIGTLGRELVGLSTDVVLFFLATVVVALVGGLGPALLAAFGGALLLNFFLTPPLYTFTIAERENVITLVAMVLVAVLVALVVDRAARRAQQAAAARAEAALLASFSRSVLAGPEPLAQLLDRVREAFGLTTVAVLQQRDGQWHTSACSGPPDCTRPDQADVDVAVEPDIHLVGQGRTLPAADRRLLEAVAGQAMLALRNQQIAAEAAEARRRADATELRTALLSAVGHDLRTPLASIKAAAGGLRDPFLQLSEADRIELAATIDESADRLTRVVNNLLDSSRVATGALRPELRPVGYDEVATLALRGLDPGVDSGRVGWTSTSGYRRCSPTPGCWNGWWPTWWTTPCDTGPAPRSHCGPAATPTTSSCGWSTRGRGYRPGGPSTCSRRSSGSATATTTGSGLGLSVARGLTEAMGGTLTAEDTPGGGLTVVISLPAVAQPSELTR